VAAEEAQPVDEAVHSYERWADVHDEQREHDFEAYACNIAEARYVMRRVTRIVNEQAKAHNLEPLLHQALLQAYGTGGIQLTMSSLAERLDVPAAFASKLVTQLEGLGLVQRVASPHDRRVTLLTLTREGISRLREIDDAIHYEAAYFQRQIEPRQRLAALSIFAFYVGIDSSSPIADALRSEGAALESAEQSSAEGIAVRLDGPILRGFPGEHRLSTRTRTENH
jgi:DNA-binding MarR family transcriptional regulator